MEGRFFLIGENGVIGIEGKEWVIDWMDFVLGLY